METKNPKTQECMGHYLYGAGYFARDDNTLGLVTGKGSAQPHFCLRCPKRAQCEDEHEKRTRRLLPQGVETFERKMREGMRRGLEPTLIAIFLSQKGLDPFATVAIENFKEGHAARGKTAGPLVK